ncbi:MAG: hypothetical protein M1817_006671 [Caeruleum heppii]|nr:MAG: hypothetical protein M1817_006671 [Caeruleum heppii]
MADLPTSYIDLPPLLTPTFSPTSFANTLVQHTSNPSDTPVDISTPLSRVLFDLQEINTHIDGVTTREALPLLTHTQRRTEAADRILHRVDEDLDAVRQAYDRLQKEVVGRWEEADRVRQVTERLWGTVRVGRVVGRCLALGRQLEAQMAEVLGRGMTTAREVGEEKKKTKLKEGREDHRALVRASQTLLSVRQILSGPSTTTTPGSEADDLDRIHVIASLRREVIVPAESTLRNRSQQIVREFSISPAGASTSISSPTPTASTYTQIEETRSRTTSALQTLYLLSSPESLKPSPTPQPDLLLSTLQAYLSTAQTSSLAALARALATLPTLDKTLREVSARCQNIVALEFLLGQTKIPVPSAVAAATNPPASHPDQDTPRHLLAPLLVSLETTSLPSHFWRTLASALSSRVQEIVNRGGAPARTLRTNRESVREAVRACVLRGVEGTGKQGSTGRSRREMEGKNEGQDGGREKARSWEREVAVMVGAVVGALGR